MYEKFKKLLEEHGDTIYRVAKDCGIPPQVLYDWKNGRCSPKAKTLKKIAEYYGIRLEELIDD